MLIWENDDQQLDLGVCLGVILPRGKQSPRYLNHTQAQGDAPYFSVGLYPPIYGYFISSP